MIPSKPNPSPGSRPTAPQPGRSESPASGPASQAPAPAARMVKYAPIPPPPIVDKSVSLDELKRIEASWRRKNQVTSQTWIPDALKHKSLPQFLLEGLGMKLFPPVQRSLNAVIADGTMKIRPHRSEKPTEEENIILRDFGEKRDAMRKREWDMLTLENKDPLPALRGETGASYVIGCDQETGAKKALIMGEKGRVLLDIRRSSADTVPLLSGTTDKNGQALKPYAMVHEHPPLSTVDPAKLKEARDMGCPSAYVYHMPSPPDIMGSLETATESGARWYVIMRDSVLRFGPAHDGKGRDGTGYEVVKLVPSPLRKEGGESVIDGLLEQAKPRLVG